MRRRKPWPSACAPNCRTATASWRRGCPPTAGARRAASSRRVRRRRIRSPRPGGPGAYWIVGGLGGLGRLFAARLADAGVGALVLSGRAADPPASALEALAARGVAVEYRALDVTDAAATQAVADAILAAHGRLDGVLHCAGVLRDGLLRGKDSAAAALVLRPKLRGAANLDAATAAVDLDLFLLCSSIAAAHGNTGQADYAAANGFLDGFALWREGEVVAGRRRGRTVAIGWPLWADGGMTVGPDTLAAIDRRMGAKPMPGDVGLGILDVLAAGAAGARATVGHGRVAALEAFFADGDVKAAGAASGGASSAAPSAASAGDLRAVVVAHLRRLLAGVLDMDAAKIRPDVAFSAYGFDSIVAVEMIGKLEETLGPLPKTLFFEYVDLNGIADHLLSAHADALQAALSPAAAPPPSPSRAERAVFAAPAVHPGERRRREIAVIGLGGRYPGAPTLERFWENLARGRHAFTPVPADRWPHRDIYFPDRSVAANRPSAPAASSTTSPPSTRAISTSRGARRN